MCLWNPRTSTRSCTLLCRIRNWYDWSNCVSTLFWFENSSKFILLRFIELRTLVFKTKQFDIKAEKNWSKKLLWLYVWLTQGEDLVCVLKNIICQIFYCVFTFWQFYNIKQVYHTYKVDAYHPISWG